TPSEVRILPSPRSRLSARGAVISGQVDLSRTRGPRLDDDAGGAERGGGARDRSDLPRLPGQRGGEHARGHRSAARARRNGRAPPDGGDGRGRARPHLGAVPVSREDVRTNLRSWEADSDSYQEEHASQLNRWDFFGWGTWDVPEDEIHALGDVSGLRA